MKRILLVVAALGATTSVAAAEPKKLADEEMGHVAAGLVAVSPAVVTPTVGALGISLNVAINTAIANAVSALSNGANAAAGNQVDLGSAANFAVDATTLVQP